MKKASSVYLVIDHTDEFLLPLGVFDSLADIARAFGMSSACVYFLFAQHRISPSLKISIEEVFIDD